ncbi:MAG: DUF2723 domain-containing protein, partial [Ignavibacteriales bacterium]|nr:DUF2723 domain-containing protein [Ignavibacteriales bacterium]
RERDYFYVGSFFIFSIWIGIGVLGIVDWVKEKFQASGGYALTGYGVLILAFLLVPANMFRANFHQADRSGNYVAWDYSYNLLQSCAQDAVLFTNGDNDTFPLWYLQDVEGIRRDVRVVCLSLLNTNWYIRQLKHEQPYGSKKISMMTPDVDIDNIGPRQFEPRVIKLPVPGDVMRQFGVEGTAGTINMKDKGIPAPDTISFYMQNTLQVGDVKALRVQDLMVFDIIVSSNWERPIYFAMTVAPDGQIGLRDYMQLEGLAFRLTPKKGASYWANINEYRMRAQLFTDVEKPSKTLALGYRWRGLDNKKTYFDEDVRRLMTNYRQSFGLLAQYYANLPGQNSKVIETLDRMEKLIPRSVIAMDYRTKIYVANLYNLTGKEDRFHELNKEIVDELKPVVARGVADPLTYDNPYVVLLQVYESMQEFDEALKLVDQIRVVYSKEPGIDQSITQIRARLLAEQSVARKDTLAASGASKVQPQKLSPEKGK